MTERLLVQSRAWSPASGDSKGYTLSSEMLELVRSRLGLIAGVIIGGTIVATGIGHFLVHSFHEDPPAHWNLLRFSQLGVIVTCLGVILLTRWRSFPDHALPQLGLGFTLVGAFFLSLPGYWGELLLQDNMGRLPWVAMWLVLIPLIVPLPPWRTVLVSFLAASFPPLVYFTWVRATHATAPDPHVLTLTFAPAYIAAGLALVPAYVLHHMGRSVAAAQDRAQQLGSYKLVKMLGKGGMGEVWHAEHNLIARPAAVKLISPEFLLDAEMSEADRKTALARFEREAKTTSALRSPHTIALYDFGVADDGSLYYVMEMLEGTDLESLIVDFGPISPARVIHILSQACCSLAEAHGTGLIHRDIKPANIYVCKLGMTYDHVKVLDFGLVGIHENAQKTQEIKLTAEGYMVGTPAFLAPETAEGTNVDHRADIYALGCVGYWLLTAQFVFQEESAIKMILAHVNEEPVPPSERIEGNVPADLEAVILDCLRKDPAQRPGGAMELIDRLRACAVDDTWTQTDARTWWEDHLTGRVLQKPHELATAVTESWPLMPPPE